MDDSFKPILINENRYPGTTSINKKNEINPNIKRYLLSYMIPIGITEIKIKRIKMIVKFLIFLKEYLNEFDMIFPISIESPKLFYLFFLIILSIMDKQ